MTKIIFELQYVSVLMSAAIGGYFYRSFNSFCRVIYWQVLIYAIVYTSARLVVKYAAALRIAPNTHWLYNAHLAVETAILLFGAFLLLRSERSMMPMRMAYVLFLGVLCFQLYQWSFFHFANLAQMLAGIVISVSYLTVLYKRFQVENFSWRTFPELWLCLGILVYFAGIIPYSGMMHNLQTTNTELNSYLFHYIVYALACIRYLLCLVSFIIVAQNRGAGYE
jgi:hypothetical protein